MNPYIEAQRAKYDALRTSIEALQTRAADDKRDLTEDELRSVKDQAEAAKKLAEQITDLAEVEQRNAKVAALDFKVNGGGEEVRTSTTTTQLRDPGHYRSVKDGGQRSFFADLVRSREGDDEALRRLRENESFRTQDRSLTSSSAGTGILPPHWLTDEYEGIARQTRRVADAVRHITISDARPLTLPKATAGIPVATQSSEGTATSFTDAFNTGVDTLTPTTQAAGQKVSRQLLDGSTPAVDQIIFQDLIAAYNSKIETLVCSTMVTAAGTAVVAYATDSTAYTTAITPTATGVPFIKDLRKTATSVRNLRKIPADIVVASVSRYGTWLDITDTQGRPLIPVAEYGTVNANGTGSVASDGHILGLTVLASDGLAYQTYPESILVARSQDTLLAESAAVRFTYEQPDGPELVRVGIWAYAGALTRFPNASVQRLQITAA